MDLLTRRTLLASAGAAVTVAALPRPAEAPHNAPGGTVLTTDLALDGDMDDWYDVACFAALGGRYVALDKPTEPAVTAISQLGLVAVDPRMVMAAPAIISVGSPANASWWYRDYDQRVALFAGDADGQPGYVENNEALHPMAFASLRGLAACRWVPCFAGGAWRTDGVRASWVQTTDQALLDGIAVRWWFERWRPDRLYREPRNLWVGPLIRFGWTDTWRDNTVAGSFRAGPALLDDMVTGTRELLASSRLPSAPSA